MNPVFSETYVNFALSSSQAAILTGQKLQADDPLYNMVMCFSINGILDPVVFQNAFKKLVNHCDALRTIIIEKEGSVPQQRVFDELDVQLPLVDLSGMADPSLEAENFISKHKMKSFELSELLYESVLIKIANDQYVWYLNQHHIATDAWSMGVIFDKMQAFYLACLDNTNKPNIIEPAPRFEQYVTDEQKKSETKAFQRASAYWQKQSKVPFSQSHFYARNVVPKQGKTRRIDIHFGAQRSNKLRSLVAAHFSALSQDMAFMQVFSTLLMAYLYRMGGQQHVSVGTPVHSRRTDALRHTTGLLISLFPLQVQIDESDTFLTLYQKVAKANQNLLINALPGSGDVNLAGAFDVVLNYLPSRFGDFAGIPTSTTWHHADCGDRNHLLRLQVQDLNDNGEFSLCFDANDEKFNEQNQAWLCDHFLRLVDACFSDVQCNIGQPNLVDFESSFIHSKVNADTTVFSQSALGLVLPALEKATKNFAADTAIQQGSDFISYQTLAEKSNEFAQHLLAKGIQKGDVVGIMLDRSIQTVIAIQGILKAGAVFMPLDGEYPKSRITFMLADAEAKLLLVDSTSEKYDSGIETLNILATREEINPVNVELPLIEGQDLAYIIYTSGSTGKPKGVAVKHQGLGNYITWAQRYYLDGQRLSFAHFSSLCFDLTITSLFVPLVSGGKLVVYPSASSSDSSPIFSVIEDNLVDVIKLTPAHLALIQTHDYGQSRLKKLIVGGDDFKTELAQQFSRFFAGQIDIYNEYGPTEATVACSVHKYDPAQDVYGSVPIGKPIVNTDIYILDHHMNRVPQGVIGQIYISGVGLAQGYVKNQTLTQQRFVNNPHQSDCLMYLSGDLGFINEQGTIEYVGRADNQVKINGVRIETGEIESALLGLADVTDVVVDVSAHVSQTEQSDHTQHCVNCGLEASHPSAQLDETQTCRLCRIYLNQEEQAQAYFRTLPELQHWIDKIRRAAPNKQDAIMLLSGGKDSSYALCKLVDMGLTPLVFTLDNGYISEGAKENVRRLVDRLGLELVEASTPAMNDIFKDSLTRFSNVCNGCFKTIYTLSMKIARERGIKVICTGLSRGQIFETRVAHLFQQGCFDSNTIDQRIIDARKAYHRTNDIIANRLDVKVFNDDSIFEEIEYLDFYRYTDVTLDEMYDYLNNIAPWIRPSDTGRSTNCLINDAGIYIHKKERGFHNYSLPYSWDVRLGHKQRDAALEELDDEIDIGKVEKILGEIGYQSEYVKTEVSHKSHLIGYYVSHAEILKNTLQKHLLDTLPKEFIPSQFVWMKQLPLTANGKVDRKSLPQPRVSRRDIQVDYTAPESREQYIIVTLWQQILGIEEVGIDDNFFDLGGDSIVNIQIVAACRKQGIELSPQQIFDYPTIRELSKNIGTIATIQATQGDVIGELGLLPSQQRYLHDLKVTPNRFNQAVVVDVGLVIDPNIIQKSVQNLLSHHDGLRTSLTLQDNIWRQKLVPQEAASVYIETSQLQVSDSLSWQHIFDDTIDKLTLKLDLAKSQLLALSVLHDEVSGSTKWVMVLNHMVCDGVSWWILLNDLESSIRSLSQGEAISLPDKTCSLMQWHDGLIRYSDSSQMHDQARYWDEIDLQIGLLAKPTDKILDAEKNSWISITSRLNVEDTRKLLNDMPKRLSVQIQDVVLTALAHALFDQFSTNTIKVDIEGHGREELIEGLSTLRTIGWFTSLYPQVFARDTLSFDGHDLNRIKQWQRTVPDNGAGYALRSKEKQQTDLTHISQVLFNYMGMWEKTLTSDSMFQFAQPLKTSYGHNNQGYLIACNAMIFAQQLEITFDIDSERLGIDAEQFTKTFENKLTALIYAGMNEDLSGFTPSDFPSADVNQHDLDDIFAEFGEE